MDLHLDIIDTIFILSDQYTKYSLKKACKFYYARYQAIYVDPIRDKLYYGFFHEGKLIKKILYSRYESTNRLKMVSNIVHLIRLKQTSDNTKIIVRELESKKEDIYNFYYKRKSLKPSREIHKNNKLIREHKLNSYRKRRVFSLMVNNSTNHVGRFTGTIPMQAAKKIFSKRIKNEETDFVIMEITRGSARKYYYYTGKKILLPTPIVVHIRGNTITYKYKCIVNARERKCEFMIDHDY